MNSARSNSVGPGASSGSIEMMARMVKSLKSKLKSYFDGDVDTLDLDDFDMTMYKRVKVYLAVIFNCFRFCPKRMETLKHFKDSFDKGKSLLDKDFNIRMLLKQIKRNRKDIDDLIKLNYLHHRPAGNDNNKGVRVALAVVPSNENARDNSDLGVLEE